MYPGKIPKSFVQGFIITLYFHKIFFLEYIKFMAILF